MNTVNKKFSIFPPLGVARIGNSDEFYFASDIPGQATFPKDGFKDSHGRLKKQVVRFRIYELDENNHALREITLNDSITIEWRVHVANRKSSWYKFTNALDLEGQAIPSNLRNESIVGEERLKLIIDPGSKRISGRNTSGVNFELDDGHFFNKKVSLGEIRTDNLGRLLVFGGSGDSGSYDGSSATTFANNDKWYDDVSDGTIRATVKIGNLTYEAEPAVVVVAPPNYGQGLFGVVTMYDVALDLFTRSNWIEEPKQVVFFKHIYPIFKRTVETQWVNEGFYILFGHNSPSNFTEEQFLRKLSDSSEEFKSIREKVFQWFRKPFQKVYEPTKLPPFYGDAFGDYEKEPNVDLPLTSLQYKLMEKWVKGDFEVGQPDELQDFDNLDPQLQVEALIRAPLEECLGGPFHPGIELSWPFRNLIFWEKPFRIKLLSENDKPKDEYGPLLSSKIALQVGGPLDGSGPGSITRWLGVPWQTDEASCLSGYDTSLYLTLPSFWAARVPNQVLSENSYQRLSDPTLKIPQRLKHFDYRNDWLRDLGTQYISRINKMIKKWHELGVIAPHPVKDESKNEWIPERLWVETDRGPFDEDDSTFKQVLIAENANGPSMEASLAILNFVASRKNAPDRPVRKRPQFKQDEL